MRLAVAADHAGYELKGPLVDELQRLGHLVLDLAPDAPRQGDDYPDFARRVCEAVRAGSADRALVICGSGVGVTVAANKFPGIRAGMCHDSYSARQGVEHDDMNVLCLGSRVVGEELARDVVRAFVSASFRPEDRHVRRLHKVRDIEASFAKGG